MHMCVQSACVVFDRENVSIKTIRTWVALFALSFYILDRQWQAAPESNTHLCSTKFAGMLPKDVVASNNMVGNPGGGKAASLDCVAGPTSRDQGCTDADEAYMDFRGCQTIL